MHWSDFANQQLIGSTAETPAGIIGENIQAHFVRLSMQAFVASQGLPAAFPVDGETHDLSRPIVQPGPSEALDAALQFACCPAHINR